MPERTTPRLAVGTLAALAAAKLLLHLAAIERYGYFRDELYYLASTEHLDWGYVDHPPLSIALLALVRAVFGDSLVALRSVPVLAGVATVVLVGSIARRLGGGPFAQALAALAALCAPVYLGTNHYYSMNALDLLLWTLVAWALLGALERGRPRDGLLLGLLLGVGLLNKLSVLWLGFGLLVGLLATSYRRALRSAWPWLAALLAGALFLPHLLWQVRHGWPTLEFIHNATELKMAEAAPLRFLLDQVLLLNPGAAPVWIVGLAYGCFGRRDPRARVLAWTWIAVLALLLAGGRSRASYLAPAFPLLLAPGAVALERFTASRGTWLRYALVAPVLLLGLVVLPLALPVLPVETFVRYQAALGRTPRTEERQELGSLPQHYADMFGWEELARLVAQAHARLSPEEQARCRVFGQNYGEAGAIDVLGRRLGLPPAISGHNSYWLWGPGDDWDVLIIIGGDREDNAEFFEEIEIVGQTAAPWSMPYERGLDVSIARRPKVNVREAWPRLKHYI